MKPWTLLIVVASALAALIVGLAPPPAHPVLREATAGAARPTS